MTRQCHMLGISRSGFYYQPVQESQENLKVMRFLEEGYLNTPFYGLPRLLVLLVARGYEIK